MTRIDRATFSACAITKKGKRGRESFSQIGLEKDSRPLFRSAARGVDGDGQDDDRTGDEARHGFLSACLGKARGEDADDEDAEERSRRPSLSADETGAADDRRRNRLKLEAAPR